MSAAYAAIVKALPKVSKGKLSDDLFSEGYRPYRLQIAAALLRLLAMEESFGDDDVFGAKAMELVENVYGDAIYGAARVERRLQRYEKEPLLAKYVQEFERKLGGAKSTIASLSDLPRFRQTFTRLVRSPTTGTLIAPFIPSSLVGESLDEAFRSLEDFASADGPALVTAYARASRDLVALKSQSGQCGTVYASYLCEVAMHLQTLLDESYGASDAVRPADLSVSASAKRYPFEEPGAELLLKLILRNSGPGMAFSAVLRVASAEGVSYAEDVIPLGEVEVGDLAVYFPVKVSADAGTGAALLGDVSWTDGSGSERCNEFIIEFGAQSSNTDWEALGGLDPYALEPVTSMDELVGRTEIVNQLLARTQGNALGSSFVTGQKRVGKTSIVRALVSRLDEGDTPVAPIFIESGDFVSPSPERTVAALGDLLVKRMRHADERLKHLAAPDFTDALSPLTGFVSDVETSAPDVRFLVVVDEFDELPPETYRKGGVGDSLFVTLRSLGGRDQIGFILVGGEKIDFLLKHQGERLNKFATVRVDYFSHDDHWDDFEELVRAPVRDAIHIDQDAVELLYDWTAGNPFFTKLICGAMFDRAVSNRDAHVTEAEIERAVSVALKVVGVQSFQHFWDDGIEHEGSAEVTSRRRRVMLALGDALRALRVDDGGYARVTAPEEIVVARAADYGVAGEDARQELRDFVRRGVLINSDGRYRPRVPFFSAWLQDHGVQAIVTSFGESDVILQRRRVEEDVLVRPEEILEVTDRLGLYRGRQITEDAVRAWLRQFGDPDKQRLAFRLLEALKFYGGDAVRQKAREAHGVVARDLADQDARTRRGGTPIVSYLGSPGKSGTAYARLYAQENRILTATNVVAPEHLPEQISRTSEPQALIFVDDFVGTGNGAADALAELVETQPFLRELSAPIYFFALCGFESGIHRIAQAVEELGLEIQIAACDLMTEADRVFSEHSVVFPDPAERSLAELLLTEKGRDLESHYPLGYGDMQALVVFEYSCPNNSLPVLWQKTAEWRPLFPRF